MILEIILIKGSVCPPNRIHEGLAENMEKSRKCNKTNHGIAFRNCAVIASPSL